MLPILHIFLIDVIFIHRALIEVSNCDPVVNRGSRMLLNVVHVLQNHRVHLVHISVVILKDFSRIKFILGLRPSNHLAQPLEGTPKSWLHLQCFFIALYSNLLFELFFEYKP